MDYRRILTIQDISCVGQCSMTVALPILSVCGLETCILPSAVLSTHTGGFKTPVFRDMTDEIPEIWKHWQREGITFDGICTGYLGSTRQIAMVQEIIVNMAAKKGKTAVDPAMADHGRLYKGFDMAYVHAMKDLCSMADVILPNLTEACLLTDTPWQEDLSREKIHEIMDKLHRMGAKNIVLTGIGAQPGQTGALISDGREVLCCSHEKLGRDFHGTGDLFTSVFFGAWMRGKSLHDAAVLAAEFTRRAVAATLDAPAHWYGVRFETVLPWLVKALDASRCCRWEAPGTTAPAGAPDPRQ